MHIKTLTFLLCSLATIPLYGMKKSVTFAVTEETPADATGLAALITGYSVKKNAAENMNQELDFDTQVKFAQNILGYQKEAFVAVGEKQFAIVSEALTLLNGSIGAQKKQLACDLEKRLFTKQSWGFGGVAAILGATLCIWRKPLFIPRVIGFLAAATGFGIYTIAERSRYSAVRSTLESLETLQTSVTTWINTPSPFQTTLDASSEIILGNLYTDPEGSPDAWDDIHPK